MGKSVKGKYGIVVRFVTIIVVGVLVVLMISIASRMYVNTPSNAQATIKNSKTNMSMQEIQAFNSTFTPYEGKQPGVQVKAFLSRLVANAKTYKEELYKIPSVKYVTSEEDNSDCKEWQETYGDLTDTSYILEEDKEWITNYDKALSKLSDYMELKHTYFTELNTDDTGLINEVIIYYDKAEE